MVRNIFGSILALAGAAAAVLGPFHSWYEGRIGHDYRVADLFDGVTANGAGIFTSILLPFAFAALVTLAGVVARSRVLVALAGVIVLGFTVLWMVRQGQAAGSLVISGNGSGLGVGVAYTAGGGVALLLAAALMSGRRRAGRRDREQPQPYEPPPYEQQPYEPQPYDPQPYDPRPYEPQGYGQQQGYGPQGQDPGRYEEDPWPRTRDGDTQSLPTTGRWYEENGTPGTGRAARPDDPHR
ncbi:hypothetical protein [Streptomyces sp. NPDC059142]|uniref:hypothetical protein n=1 Tax=Streptomyces sp. NPDC059142 TaxID=3346739 RepID=UPI00369399AD